MSPRSYLDWNATAPMRQSVRSAMAEAFGLIGNPSSVHAEGRHARARIEEARNAVAALADADPRGVIFTSGGTEANALALAPIGGDAVCLCYLSAVEHPSVLAAGRFTKNTLRSLPVTADGVIDLEALADALADPQVQGNGQPFTVSVMVANNETGAIQPVSDVASAVKDRGGRFHTDAVQAAGKIELRMSELGAQSLSLSAHKFGGPKGVGALICDEPVRSKVLPLWQGGGQEQKKRSGTENVAGIIGMGVAAAEARAELNRAGEIAAKRDRLERDIRLRAPEAVILAEKAARLPNTSSFAVPGMRGETVVIGMDLAGVAISSGSACASGKAEQSHVLKAMRLDPAVAEGAVRVSIGRDTTDAEIDHFLAVWARLYDEFKERRAAA